MIVLIFVHCIAHCAADRMYHAAVVLSCVYVTSSSKTVSIEHAEIISSHHSFRYVHTFWCTYSSSHSRICGLCLNFRIGGETRFVGRVVSIEREVQREKHGFTT